MIYSILFVILAALSYGYWRFKFLPAEVAQNAADFKANGSADDLQRGYHGREVWSRVWPGLACCLAPVVPMVFTGWLPATMAFLAMASLLLGVFVRDFTPKLNLARIANGDAWLATEWYASPASKSWPDAACWKIARQAPAEMLPDDRQDYANHLLKQRLIRTYRWCLAASLALATAAVVVAR